MVANPILEVRPLKNIYQKKVLISQIRGHGEHREACPVIFSNSSIFNRTLKMARYEGFAGGLKKKMGSGVPGSQCRPEPAWAGPLWLPHSLSVASTEAARCGAEAREAREARAARAKV